MKPAPTIFKYKKGKKIGEIGITVFILFLIVFILDSVASELVKKISPILIGVYLISVISYFYLLNEHFAMDNEGIFITKKIGKSTNIPFTKIRSVTIREEENLVGANRVVISIFAIKNTKIILSDLVGQFRMIEQIEEKGKEFGFKVVYQRLDRNPKINKV